MEFNPGDGTGIVDDVLSRLGSGINLSNYPIAAITRSVNSRKDLIWSIIFDKYAGFLFLDKNKNSSTPSDTLPYADLNITSGTPLIFLPDAALSVNGAEIKYQNSTTFMPLPLLTFEEFLKMGGDGRFPGTGAPSYALPYGNVVRLVQTPNYSQASSLRVFFDEGLGDFLSSDTTKAPGFASPFHVMLAIGAAIDYAESHPGMEAKAVVLGRAWDKWEMRLGSYYANRYKARLPKRIYPGEDLVEEFM